MEAEELMKLYDSIWFERKILPSSSSETNPDDQNKDPCSEISKSHKLTLHSRAMSDQSSLKSSLVSSVYLTPDSVLHGTKLHRIISGEEITEEKKKQSHMEVASKKVNNIIPSGRRRIKKVNESKSLSELEFEELKGFTDLGFVFSEEDYKESSLVSIVPGLQRLMDKKLNGVEERSSVDESAVSRPYLSEAWEVLERRKTEKPLMSWRVPALSNEIDVKDNLRWWAHTVASAVR